jgi:hypothetical protein
MTMAYGATTDWFGEAGTGINLQTSSESKKYNIDAAIQDSGGDFACRTKSDTETEYSCAYRVTGGGDTNNLHSLDDFGKVGEIKTYDTNTKIQVTSVEVATDNKSFPIVTLSGVKDPAGVQTHPTYSSGVTFTAAKRAQKIGLGAITGKLVSSSVSVSGSIATAQDSLGVTVKREPEGVRAVATNSLQACTGAVAAVADTANGWKTETPLSGDQSNTDYGTSTIAAFKDIVRDS